MWNLRCEHVQSDEIWTFVGKKQRWVRESDSDELGDAWVFVAIDADNKLVSTFAVGKRNLATTHALIGDLKQRLAKRVQLTTDGFRFYVDAVEEHFGAEF
jgi:IS1 family transposase